MFNTVTRALLAAGLLATAPAHAQTAKDFNVFVFGNYTSENTDVEGRLAAGGDISLRNYGVGNKLPGTANGTDTLIAGGKLTTQNFRLYEGDAVAGSLAIGAGSTFLGAAPRIGTAMDFVAEAARVSAISQSLAGEATTGTILWQFGAYTLTGANAGLNVFNISGANLSTANTFTISAPKGSQVLVNVDGTANDFRNMGTFLNGGLTAGNVLFNFSNTTALNIAGISIQGSILAPKAAVQFDNGQFNGTLIAASSQGYGEFHHVPYTGTLLDPTIAPVPEPASWALMVGGFGAMGVAMRRRRRSGNRLATA